MRELFKRLYKMEPYTSRVEQRQATAGYIVVAGIAGLFLLMTIIILAAYLFAGRASSAASLSQLFILPLLIAVAWYGLQSGQLWLAQLLLFGGGAIAYGFTLSISDRTTILVVIPALYLAMGVLLLDWQSILAVGAIFCTIMTLGILQWHELAPMHLVPIVFIYLLVTTLNTVLVRSWYTFVSEEVTSQRLRMVELSGEVSQLIFQRTDPDTLLTDTVNAIRERFDAIYHAQIFLIDDERQYAVLKASTGRAGQELLGRGHRLELGSESVIGRVTTQEEPVLARDTASDSLHFRNELLPATRTELALPLISGQAVIGALDVQSARADAFSPDDIGILEALASQIAVALDNAQLVNEQQTIIAENQRLAQQAQNQVRLIQDLNQRLTRHAWGEYLDQQDLAPALTVDFNSAAMTPNATWTPGLAEAVNSGKIVKQMEVSGSDAATIAVPLIIRGQVVGAMEFEVTQSAVPTPDEENLIQNVASRLALSLESSRLYDEAQRLALREQVINDITSRLQTTSGMEGALLMAAQGLQNALNAPHIAIRLGTPPAVSSPDNNAAGQETA